MPPRNDRFSPTVDWRQAGYRYYAYGYYLKQRFGRRVQKVSVDAGFTCPNVDGTVAIGGCNFCDNRSFSPSRRIPRRDILSQIEVGIANLRRRYPNCDQFTAYFQPATNTYAPVARLREVYQRALEHPQIVALAIGTRPDCVPDDVLELLAEFGQRTVLTVEYGMQTMHDHSLAWMNRGHDHESLVDAVSRSAGRSFEVCAHLILGLPTEGREQMVETAREVARLPIDSVKLHNLYAVRRTPLGDQVEREGLQLMELDEYAAVLVDCLEVLPPQLVVERVSGDAPPDYLIGPDWCLDKPRIRAAIEAEFQRRDSWQGKYYRGV